MSVCACVSVSGGWLDILGLHDFEDLGWLVCGCFRQWDWSHAGDGLGVLVWVWVCVCLVTACC